MDGTLDCDHFTKGRTKSNNPIIFTPTQAILGKLKRNTFLKGGYPIIVASNVFHNSHLIQKCIQNQQQLLTLACQHKSTYCQFLYLQKIDQLENQILVNLKLFFIPPY